MPSTCSIRDPDAQLYQDGRLRRSGVETETLTVSYQVVEDAAYTIPSHTL